ncbi:MAG: hypothetical protein ACPGWM_05725 [Flavobacteriales bacterium]
MKKILTVIVVVLGLAAVLTSCTPTKQSCAAYDHIEMEDQAK